RLSSTSDGRPGRCRTLTSRESAVVHVGWSVGSARMAVGVCAWSGRGQRWAHARYEVAKGGEGITCDSVVPRGGREAATPRTISLASGHDWTDELEYGLQLAERDPD